MKEMIRYGLILAVICTVASGLLAGVYTFTKGRIIAQAQAEEDASLKEVLPDAAHFEPVMSGDEVVYYKAHNKDGAFIGVAFKAQGKGYSSLVETIVGMLVDGTITAIKVVSQGETPGLGARVIEPAFSGQFARTTIADIDKVQAITGATISSRAVIDSVKKKAQEIKELIK